MSSKMNLSDLSRRSNCGFDYDKTLSDSKLSDSKGTLMKKTKRKRKSTKDTLDIDVAIEDKIHQCAMKNNLTATNIKNILKKVVGNDHVLAIVKLREEELEKDHNQGQTDDENADNMEIIPKLTRLKAKELNKQPLPIIPLKAPQQNSEVAVLIKEDLGSDDDDDEYKPSEEDYHSDDETNTTVSDIDSQPRTPGDALGINECDDRDNEVTLSKDGLFKIPRNINDPFHSEENIALRTRSKLCLTKTPIEILEETFVPPDITTDMYEVDCDVDNVWREFLTEFRKPLDHNTEEDDEADPEYIAADQIPIDKEELREVRVSKKELSDLIAELFDGLDEDLTNEILNNVNEMDTETKTKDYPSSNIDRTQQIEKELNEIGEGSTSVISFMKNNDLLTEQQNLSAPVQSNNESYFQPSNISTPTKIYPTNQDLKLPVDNCQTIQTHPDINLLASSIVIPNATNLYQNIQTNKTGYFQLIPPVIVPQVTVLALESNEINITPNITRREILLKYRERKYGYLETLLPSKQEFSQEYGFTDEQRRILDQQMRIHVQLCTQNFMQTYSHPIFWKFAVNWKNQLMELKTNMDNCETSAFNAWNLKMAIDLCNEWESELSVINEENSNLMKFWNKQVDDEMERYHKGSYDIHNDFPDRLMEKIINSKVFLYPKLLPHGVFKTYTLNSKQKPIITSEFFVIAQGLEFFYDALANKNERKLTPPLTDVCKNIAKYICTARTSGQIYGCIIRYKSNCYPGFNALKYYFKHKKAPPVTHALEPLDFDNILAPVDYPNNVLPKSWEKYVFSNERIKNTVKNPKVYEENISEPPLQIIQNDSDESSNLIASQPHVTTQLNNIKIDYNLPVQYFLPKSATVNIIYENNSTKSLPDKPELLFRTTISPNKFNTEVTNINIDINCNDQDNYEEPSISQITPSTSIESLESGSLQIDDKESLETLCHYQHRKRTRLRKGTKRKIKYFKSLSRKTIISKEAQINRKRKERSIILKAKLNEILLNFSNINNVYGHNVNINEQSILAKIFHYIIEFDIFANLFWKSYKMNVFKRSYKVNATCTSSENTNNVKKSKLNEDNCDMKANENKEFVAMSKRQQKGHRFNDSNRLLLLPERKEDLLEKDSLYAWNFFEKVEQILMTSNKHDDFDQFLNILTSFNPLKDEVADLYYKLENLFLPDHPELAEIFLTFLLPGHAAQVGKFFEHFILTNMSTFLNKLNVYFSKQPAQIKKIHLCLNELSVEKELTMDKIKTKFLPLLKGNQLLIDWFLQLFPNERAPECHDSDYETLNLKKIESLSDKPDICEILSPNDILSDAFENSPCAIKYMQGRIYYGNRVLLPAELSFLAVDQENIDILKKRSHSKHDEPVTCVHDIRQSWDLKLQEEKQKYSMDNDPGPVHTIIERSEKFTIDVIKDEVNENTTECRTKLGEFSYKLCDTTTLKMHANRLNPLGINGEMLNVGSSLSTLSPSLSDKSKDYSDEINTKSSPKKQSGSQLTIPTLKMSRKNPFSPKRNITKNININKAVIDPNSSPSVLMSRKLNAFIDGTDCKTIKSKRKPTKTIENIDLNISSKPLDEKTASGQQSNGYTEEIVAPSSTDISATNSQKLTVSWTREEDKVILEEINGDLVSQEEIFEKLKNSLSQRTKDEIIERFRFLIDLLEKFDNVT